jgi:short-subunit dehydrogenase
MNKTALITGASVGIGYELAKQFARGGHDVILVARNLDKLNEVAGEIRKLNVKAEVITSDLAQSSAPRELFEEVGRRGITVDYLVNNAGFGALGKFDELDLQRQLDMIQVNVTALTELTHRFLQPMIGRKSGGILNVASTASFQPGPLMAIYYATKAYVLSFTEAIAEELKSTGIRVTALCPGPTYSEFRSRAKMESSNVFRSKTIPVMTAVDVARAGYEGLMRGKRIVIPGWMNKLGVFSTRLGPRSVVTRMAGKINKAK